MHTQQVDTLYPRYPTCTAMYVLILTLGVSPVEYKSVDTECSSEMADVVLQYLKQIEDLK